MDKRVYLLVYEHSVGTREDVKAWVNETPEVITWRYDLPNSFYLVSRCSADELTELFRDELSKGRFIITEISENRQGWLPSKTWHLLREKKLAP